MPYSGSDLWWSLGQNITVAMDFENRTDYITQCEMTVRAHSYNSGMYHSLTGATFLAFVAVATGVGKPRKCRLATGTDSETVAGFEVMTTQMS